MSVVVGAHAVVAQLLQPLQSPQLQLSVQLRVLVCDPSPHGPQLCGREPVSPYAHSPPPMQAPHSLQPFQPQLLLQVRER